MRSPCRELSANHWKGDIESSGWEECCGCHSLQLVGRRLRKGTGRGRLVKSPTVGQEAGSGLTSSISDSFLLLMCNIFSQKVFVFNIVLPDLSTQLKPRDSSTALHVGHLLRGDGHILASPHLPLLIPPQEDPCAGRAPQ